MEGCGLINRVMDMVKRITVETVVDNGGIRMRRAKAIEARLIGACLPNNFCRRNAAAQGINRLGVPFLIRL